MDCGRCSCGPSNSVRYGVVKYVDRSPLVVVTSATVRFGSALRGPVSTTVIQLNTFIRFMDSN